MAVDNMGQFPKMRGMVKKKDDSNDVDSSLSPMSDEDVHALPNGPNSPSPMKMPPNQSTMPSMNFGNSPDLNGAGGMDNTTPLNRNLNRGGDVLNAGMSAMGHQQGQLSPEVLRALQSIMQNPNARHSAQGPITPPPLSSIPPSQELNGAGGMSMPSQMPAPVPNGAQAGATPTPNSMEMKALLLRRMMDQGQ